MLGASKKSLLGIPLQEILLPQYVENHSLIKHMITHGYCFNTDFEQVNSTEDGHVIMLRNQGFGIIEKNYLIGVIGRVVSINY